MAELIEDVPTKQINHWKETANLAFTIIEMLKGDGAVLTQEENQRHESYRNNQQK